MARTVIDQEKIHDLLTRGVAEVIEHDHLQERLRRGDRLRVKFGIDPTGPILHLGHAVVLRLLRRFQDLGHTVIFLVGDFTARIGDPTGRVESRPVLSDADIKKNMRTYVAQASRVIDMKRAEVRYNSEWLGTMSVAEMYLLASKVTYGQVSARADFKKRLAEDEDFSVSEFLYPVFQGYDSVALHADVEVGGTDQTFNLLMGRRIQKRYDQEPQDIVTVPLLVGLDGEKKMGKSEENFIALQEKPDEMFGKLMSIPDALVRPYFELLTDVPAAELEEVLATHPRDAKMRLAYEVTKWLHGEAEAMGAQKAFGDRFQSRKGSNEAKVIHMRELGAAKSFSIADVLVHPAVAMCTSKSDARRLVEQGGVRVGDALEKIRDPHFNVLVDLPASGLLIEVGKKRERFRIMPT